ncbi:hypothetical protein D3C80_2050300 [compost metagenome]
MPLIIPPVPTSLDRVELRKLLLPIPQHMRFDRTELADFTDGEVAFARYGRQLVVMTWFQHRPQPGPSVSALDER